MTTVSVLKNIDHYSGHAIASVMKKFFTKLTTPIVPNEMVDQLLNISMTPEDKRI